MFHIAQLSDKNLRMIKISNSLIKKELPLVTAYQMPGYSAIIAIGHSGFFLPRGMAVTDQTVPLFQITCLRSLYFAILSGDHVDGTEASSVRLIPVIECVPLRGHAQDFNLKIKFIIPTASIILSTALPSHRRVQSRYYL